MVSQNIAFAFGVGLRRMTSSFVGQPSCLQHPVLKVLLDKSFVEMLVTRAWLHSYSHATVLSRALTALFMVMCVRPPAPPAPSLAAPAPFVQTLIYDDDVRAPPLPLLPLAWLPQPPCHLQKKACA